jgi:hypothetical protein
MSIDVDDAFTKQFEAEVHHLYQRSGSRLRYTVRQKTVTDAKSTTFQVIGKGSATQKSRHTSIPLMNISHTPVECVLQDWFAADQADDLDLLKTNIDERGALAKAGAQALGRKTDTLITDVMDGVSTLSAAVSWSLNIAQDMIEALSDADVSFSEGQVFAPVGWRQWNIMMNDSAFSSSDFVGDHPLANGNFGLAKMWSGVVWFPCSGDCLPKSGNNRSVFMYHMDAVGCATGHEMSSEIAWIPKEDSWLIKNKMSQNAVVIDATGITKVTVDES